MIPINRYYILILAYFLFYSFSTPFPKNVGLFEVLNGAMLVLLFYQDVMVGLKKVDPFLMLLCLTILVGLFVGVSNGSDLRDVVRDVFPHFAYFSVAFFYFNYGFKKYLDNLSSAEVERLILILFLWALVFCVRTYTGFDSIQVGKFNAIEGHLTQSPLFFATSMFGLCYFFHEFPRISVLSAIGLMVALLGIACYSLAVLRGPTLMHIIVVIVSFAIPSKPKKFISNILILISLFSLFFIVFYDSFFSHAVEAIVYKSETYGVTSKDKEFMMAVDYWLSGDGFDHIFGYGFGSLWIGPFGVFSFTHNILSYYIIKFGLLGVLFVVSLYFIVFRGAFRLLALRNVHARNASLCLLMSILFSANFESSFKAVDFAVCIFIFQFLTFNLSLKKSS